MEIAYMLIEDQGFEKCLAIQNLKQTSINENQLKLIAT